MTPYVWYTNRSVDPLYLQIPQYEISVTEGFVFGIQKCALSISQTDPECSMAPFDYTMKVMFEVEAIDPEGYVVATDRGIDFNINVENPCGND